jgi:hypothetical protein
MTVMIANLEYEDWLVADQQVLNFILRLVTKEVLVRIATTKTNKQCIEYSQGAASFVRSMFIWRSHHHLQKGLHQWQIISPRCSLLAMTWPLQAVLSTMKILSSISWLASMKTITQ